jgi:hypothetical protein
VADGASVPAEARAARANGIWSAKEAVLKTRKLGLTVDTWKVECQLSPGPSLAEPTHLDGILDLADLRVAREEFAIDPRGERGREAIGEGRPTGQRSAPREGRGSPLLAPFRPRGGPAAGRSPRVRGLRGGRTDDPGRPAASSVSRRRGRPRRRFLADKLEAKVGSPLRRGNDGGGGA